MQVFGHVLAGLVDMSLGRFEVLAEEFVGHAEERLVQEKVCVGVQCGELICHVWDDLMVEMK